MEREQEFIFGDKIARNYVKIKECEKMAKEIESGYRIDMKVYRRGLEWNYVDKYKMKEIDVYLLAKAYRKIADELRIENMNIITKMHEGE